MFTKRTALIGTAVALAAAAFAGPAQAASSDGAQVSKPGECGTYSDPRFCHSGVTVSTDVSTPSGLESSSYNSSSTYPDDQSAGSTVRTRINTHSLDRNGESIEVGQHYAQTTGRCTDQEDSQQVRDRLLYNREVYYCR
jgi:hypothetical protein